VTNEVDSQVARVKQLLDRELDRQAGPLWGCWPLLVALAGIVLGVVLLIRGF
jgi:hypothetical protein